MSNKLKFALFGLLGFLAGGYALAQDVLYPSLTGTNSANKDQIGYFGALRLKANTGLTATASGTLANSQVLSVGYSQFSTVASGNDAATLPTLNGSVICIVTNAATSNTMYVFPNISTGTINAGGAGAAFSLAAGKTAIFIQSTSGVWYAILTA